VDRQHNQYGEPVLGYDDHRWEREKALLKFPPVTFTRPEMIVVESLLPDICARGGWTHRTGASGPDHVHEILTSPNDPETTRRLFKRWLGQELSRRVHRLPDGATWWAECGSIRRIFEEDILRHRDRFRRAPARDSESGTRMSENDRHDLGQVLAAMSAARQPYREFIRVPAMSVGVYHLRAGELDKQPPHAEDEVYYVIDGRAKFARGSGGRREVREVWAGAILFVERGVEHRFIDIVEDLTLLVVFAPAEGSMAGADSAGG
jgi:mannose-6-phosphate isomerase-like protein (cupin superfamily)